MEQKKNPSNLLVQFGQGNTRGIKHQDTIFGGGAKTLIGGSERVSDLSGGDAHGLQGRNARRNNGGIRGTVTTIVKATSNVEEGHS